MANGATTATVTAVSNALSCGTKLAVRHRTVFHYGGAVRDSSNVLHLEPRTFPFQKTLSAFIKVLPATRLKRFDDLFQNITHLFELSREHDKLEIESSIKVQNLQLFLADQSFSEGFSSYDDPQIEERIWPYLQESKWVSKHSEIWRQAVDLTMHTEAIYEKVFALMLWVKNSFTYQPGSTDVNTHLEQVFEMKSGVYQDFTHVMLGMCRSLGIPARYASGYIYNGPRDTLVGAQASHAFASA